MFSFCHWLFEYVAESKQHFWIKCPFWKKICIFFFNHAVYNIHIEIEIQIEVYNVYVLNSEWKSGVEDASLNPAWLYLSAGENVK